MKRHFSFFQVLVVVVTLRLLLGGALPRAEAGGGPALPPCRDVNGDGSSDVSDAVFFLSWRFLGGPAPACPAGGGGPASLPDTGLSRCFDSAGDEVPCDDGACPGQDGRYPTGCPAEGRFADHGDGTVTDRCTGLMWQRDTADVNGDGQANDDDSASWCAALTYCEDLNFAGHDDWRLPNVRELQSLVDYGRFDQAIDPALSVSTSHVTWIYWSSTSNAEAPVNAWTVRYAAGFHYGKVDKAGAYYVRAVRGGTSALPPCRDVNGDGSSDVSDAVSFLGWLFLGGPAPACPAAGEGPSGLPDTGQSRCFDDAGAEISCDSAACPGQDGRYATGCPPEGRFTDHGDGTVTDRCTGLMWQRDTADVNGDGQANDDDSASWCAALAYCEDLNFAGHDDWRLPNVRELLSLADYGRLDQSIAPAFSVSPPATTLGYRSSTTYPEFPGSAWTVRHAIGYDLGSLDKVDATHVRAVRTAP
jgi:hypothetical protein